MPAPAAAGPSGRPWRAIPRAQALAGIVAAVDTALATYIVPYARYREMDISALMPLMAGFAQAEAGAE